MRVIRRLPAPAPSLSLGQEEGGGRREEGRGQPLVYLPPVLFTLSGLNPLVEHRGGGQNKKKKKGEERTERERKWQKEKEETRRTEFLHQLKKDG